MVILFCCRVFLRLSGSAVLVIPLGEHFMSSFTALGFLLQKFWRESKSRIFRFLVLIPGWIWIHIFHVLLNQFYYPEVLICHYYFFYSYDDKTACQMILDKRGLKGYQVIQIIHVRCIFSFSTSCLAAA